MAKKLGVKSINANVLAAQYAVRGPIVARSQQYNQQLNEGTASLPFKQVINCNIGNPQQLRQPPVSYIRDVLSIVTNPSLMERGQSLFEPDVMARASKYLDPKVGGAISAGAYTDSHGLLAVRKEVSAFLEERDGFGADLGDIILTNGASDAVKLCMQTIYRPRSAGFNDGLLTPIPQYPLYSALCELLDAHLVPYYLDEENGWTCSREKLELALKKADSVDTRGLVVINPGNPTGQVLSRGDIEEVIQFCMGNGIVCMADEVYQENVYAEGKEFLSFRKVAKEMGALDGDDGLQLISFHSISKGFLGECGLRGGYVEMLGLDPEVKAEISKLASISLCSNVIGQVCVGLMVQPPKVGDVSYSRYSSERSELLGSLERRAKRAHATLNKLEGVSCQPIEGALYAFPTITLSQKAIDAASTKGMAADAFYVSELLDATGIVLVPGSGFHQKEGTFHFRTTILPPEETLDVFFTLLKEFHSSFMAKYRD
jgi:alanine transaminase